jgi:hypothetical protein
MMGIFQYFLLYACPKPGRAAEYKAAVFGLFSRVSITTSVTSAGFTISESPGPIYTAVESFASWAKATIRNNKMNKHVMKVYFKTDGFTDQVFQEFC